MPNRLMKTISIAAVYLAVQLTALYLVASMWTVGLSAIL